MTEEEKQPAALIIGAGIAGIQAALDIANAGFKVYLVEREPSIGGHMSQLDKTFPTLDCSACIMTPKMVDVANHPNITLHTYSEIETVDGYIGNFTITVRKKARSVDMDKESRVLQVRGARGFLGGALEDAPPTTMRLFRLTVTN